MPNSKRKGSKNERGISKLFTDWTGYEFARTPSSGGLRWKKRDDVVGDIVCADQSHSMRFPFSVEAKFHRDIKFEHLISGNTKVKVMEFWGQACADALRAEKVPILMMRYNGMAKDYHYLCIPIKLFRILKPHITFTYGYLLYIKGDIGFAIMGSNDWFNTDYKEIRLLTKKYLRDGS